MNIEEIIEAEVRKADLAEGGRVAAVERGPAGLFQELHVAYLWQTSMRRFLGLPDDAHPGAIDLAVRTLKDRVAKLELEIARRDLDERVQSQLSAQVAAAVRATKRAEAAESRVKVLEELVSALELAHGHGPLVTAPVKCAEESP